jgi:hypothetical protein
MLAFQHCWGFKPFTVTNQAVEHLLPARVDLWKMGGSKAQRDVADWTLTEAARRAGLRDTAVGLAYERMGSRPNSVPNRRFQQQAQALSW